MSVLPYVDCKTIKDVIIKTYEEKQYEKILVQEVLADTKAICKDNKWSGVCLFANKKTLDELRRQIAEMEGVADLEEVVLLGEKVKFELARYENIDFILSDDMNDGEVVWRNGHWERADEDSRMTWVMNVRESRLEVPNEWIATEMKKYFEG